MSGLFTWYGQIMDFYIPASMLALLFAFQCGCYLDGIHYLKICRLGYEIFVFFKRV